MASVTHQALLMRSAAYVPTAGWFQPLSVVAKTAPRAMSSINADGAWLAALAFAATGVKGLQWQQPLSIPVRTRRDIAGFNSDGAWLAAIRPVAVAGGVAWQQPLSVPISRSQIQASSIVDPSSYAQAWISAAAHPDPYWANVVLLMGFEGADASTGSPGMTDESVAAHGDATIRGTAQIDTGQFKFGTSSLQLDGGGSITFPDSNDWNFASGLFTVELWVRFSDIANGLQSIICQLLTPSQRAWQILSNTIVAQIVWIVSTTGSSNLSDIHGASTPSNNVWYHIAVDYDGIKYRSYINGALDGSFATPRTIFDASTVLAIGADSNNNAKFKGWIDEVRITKGVARYASDSGFTAPTARFPR